VPRRISSHYEELVIVYGCFKEMSREFNKATILFDESAIYMGRLPPARQRRSWKWVRPPEVGLVNRYSKLTSV